MEQELKPIEILQIFLDEFNRKYQGMPIANMNTDPKSGGFSNTLILTCEEYEYKGKQLIKITVGNALFDSHTIPNTINDTVKCLGGIISNLFTNQFKAGQDTIRKAFKELLNITIDR
jgi:hypothetical protein